MGGFACPCSVRVTLVWASARDCDTALALMLRRAAPACNVGSVPVGEYLFNPLAANTSVNGTRFIDWFIK